MNVPMLASRVARRYASLRSAGLFDRDLVAKAVQVLLHDHQGTYLRREGDWDVLSTETYSFGYTYGVKNQYYGKHRDYPADWDYDDVEGEEDVDLVSAFSDEWDYSLPMSIMAQVPPAQHMEFMQEVLQAMLYKEGAFANAKAFLETFYPDSSPFHDFSEGDFDFNSLALKSAKMKPPVFLSKRVLYRGKVATVRIKMVYTNIVIDPDRSDYEWTGSPPEPDYDGPEPDDYYDDGGW